MGTKLYIMFASWFVTFISNNYMPLDWEVLQLSTYAITMGACCGYNLWLAWSDQDRIMAGLITLYDFKLIKNK